MSPDPKIPDFFIVGAPKCGTTSLYHWLKDHPGIFLPAGKEPHFFAQNLSDRYVRARALQDYLDLFLPAGAAQLCGEASVLYCLFTQSLENILKANPKAKVILMLRSPVAMAPSYHRQLLLNLEEDREDFAEAWSLQQERAAGRRLPKGCTDPVLLNYRECCALGQKLETFCEIVPEPQRLVILLDDMQDDPAGLYRQVLSFLGLPDDGRRDFSPVNQAASLRSRRAQELLNRVPASLPRRLRRMFPVLRHVKGLSGLFGRLNRAPYKAGAADKLSPDMIRTLQTCFESDIRLIESYMKRDLPHWRSPAAFPRETGKA